MLRADDKIRRADGFARAMLLMLIQPICLPLRHIGAPMSIRYAHVGAIIAAEMIIITPYARRLAIVIDICRAGRYCLRLPLRFDTAASVYVITLMSAAKSLLVSCYASAPMVNTRAICRDG